MVWSKMGWGEPGSSESKREREGKASKCEERLQETEDG